MKREKKEKALIIIRELIVTQTNHWSLFALAYGLSVMLSEVYSVSRMNLLCWGIMGLGLIANYYIRIKCKNTVFLILLHLLVLGYMAATGFTEPIYLLLHAAFGLFYTMLSIVKSFGRGEMEDENFPVLVIGILVCAPFFVLSISQYEGIINTYRNLLICLFTMFFMQHFFGKYSRFVKLNEHSAGFFPKSEIMGSGLKSVIIYVGISAGLFFGIANMDSLTEFGDLLKDKIVYFIKELLRKLFGGGEAEPHESKPLDYNDFDSLTAKMGQGEAPEESLFSIIMQKIVWLLIILLILWCFYRLVKKILGLFNMKLDRPDIIVDDVVTDVRESCDKESLKSKKKKEKMFFLTPREKVRKYFKNSAKEKVFRICRSGDKNALSYKTSGECAGAVDLPEMSELYDRARYSDHEISEQDALRMRQIYEDLLKQ